MNIDKKNYPQVYLEQCKYKEKKKKEVNFIDAELNLNSDDSDESNSDNCIMYFRLTKIMHTLLGFCSNLSTLESSIKHNIFCVLKCDAYTSLK